MPCGDVIFEWSHKDISLTSPDSAFIQLLLNWNHLFRSVGPIVIHPLWEFGVPKSRSHIGQFYKDFMKKLLRNTRPRSELCDSCIKTVYATIWPFLDI